MELIRISQDAKGQSVVSAKELHEFLEVKSKFADWIKNRINAFNFQENQDYVTFSKNLENGRPEIEYAITLDMAKELSMVERNEKGKQARLYFIECEKRFLAKTPQNYLEALKALVASEEQKLLLENKVENLQTVLDDLLEWVSIIKVSKHNKVKETSFDWRVLKGKSKELGYAIKKAESPRFGYQNLYHVNVFKACYPQFDYNLK